MTVREIADCDFYDWYQVTFEVGMMPRHSEYWSMNSTSWAAVSLVHNFRENWTGSVVEEVPPRVKQYHKAVNILRGSQTIAHICWGGSNAGVHMISTGAIADEVAKFLQSESAGYRCTYGVSRADVRCDLVDPAAWEYLYGAAEGFCLKRKIKTNSMGDWLTGEAGRTFYMGSKTSVVQVRIYEKGKKDGGDPNWVRVEAQIRPSKSDHKRLVAMNSAKAMFMGSSKWLTDFYLHVLLEKDDSPRKYIGTVWKRSDLQSSVVHMVNQYGKAFAELAEELGGSENAGKFVELMIEKSREFRGQKEGMGDNPFDEVMSNFKAIEYKAVSNG